MWQGIAALVWAWASVFAAPKRKSSYVVTTLCSLLCNPPKPSALNPLTWTPTKPNTPEPASRLAGLLLASFTVHIVQYTRCVCVFVCRNINGKLWFDHVSPNDVSTKPTTTTGSNNGMVGVRWVFQCCGRGWKYGFGYDTMVSYSMYIAGLAPTRIRVKHLHNTTVQGIKDKRKLVSHCGYNFRRLKSVAELSMVNENFTSHNTIFA